MIPKATPANVAPIPPGCAGPAIPADKGYFVEEIRDGVYWVTEGVFQAMFLSTGEGVVAIDAPPTIGDNYLKAVAEVTDEPVTHVVYSHSHSDHIGTASLFPSDATYIASEDTAAILRRINDARRPMPTRTFRDRDTLTVGDKTLILENKGPDHEPGNIYIHAPDQKILMKVDVFTPGWVPFKDLSHVKDMPGYIQAHDDALTYDFDVLVPGHVARLGTREDVELQREFILDLKALATEAIETVDIQRIFDESGVADQSRPGFGNPWMLFDVYLNAVAGQAAHAMLDKWGGRLGGADVFMFDHALVMAESLRLDYGFLPRF